MGHAALGDRRIHFEVTGEGPAVLLLPGTGSGARQFGTLPKRFARRGFTCITFDPAGTGSSSMLEGPFDFVTAAAEPIAVLDALALPSAALVGTSLGGKVAFMAASQAPARCSRLVLLAASLLRTPRAAAIYRFFEVAARQLDAEGFATVVAPFLFGQTWFSERPELVADIMRGMRPDAATRTLIAKQAHALQAFDGRALAPAVRCPTLCLAGYEDTLTMASDVEASARLLPQGRFQGIPGAGHSLLLESATAFDLVVEVLRS